MLFQSTAVKGISIYLIILILWYRKMAKLEKISLYLHSFLVADEVQATVNWNTIFSYHSHYCHIHQEYIKAHAKALVFSKSVLNRALTFYWVCQWLILDTSCTHFIGLQKFDISILDKLFNTWVSMERPLLSCWTLATHDTTVNICQILNTHSFLHFALTEG